MSHMNNLIFIQSIDQNGGTVQNYNHRDPLQNNFRNNVRNSSNGQSLNQNAYENNRTQQYSSNQYDQQRENQIFGDHQLHQQNFQLLNNAQAYSNFQPYTCPQQFSQPLVIPQTNQNDQESEQQKKYPEGINYYKSYKYDLYNIEYHRISVDSWNDIPVDESPYSYMWGKPESFEPEQFSKIHSHSEKKKKRIDFFWLVFFIINSILSIAVLTYLSVKFKVSYDNKNSTFENSNSDVHFEINNIKELTIEILISVGIGAAIGLVFNIIHIIYSTFAPRTYIKDSIWLCILISILCILLLVIRGFYYAFGFPILTLILAIFFFCCMRKDMPFSASVLSVTIKLFRNYPSLILMMSFDTFFELIFGLIFSISIFFVEATETSRYIYIFICFSFLYISSTFGYLMYMTIAGLTSSWYFLKGTIYFPKKPVWDTFKRSLLISFGSASIAGFLFCFIKILEFMANSDSICCSCGRSYRNYNLNNTESTNIDDNEDRNSEHPEKALLCVLKCIAICILKILEACLPFINQYALIYCAIFEVPFKEGCRRWAEISCHKFCNLLLKGCCIKSAILFNGLIWVIGSVSLGFGISNCIFKEYNNGNFQKISISLYAFIFTYSIFQVFTQPLSTFADTLIVCFFEAPEKLKESENDLYENMRSFYESSVNEMVQSSYY